jgi:hypothetical protein
MPQEHLESIENMSNFGEKLEKTVKKHNKRQAENFQMYAEECRRQGKQVGEPVDLMAMVQHDLERKKNETEKT